MPSRQRHLLLGASVAGLPLVSWCPGHAIHHSWVAPSGNSWLSGSYPREGGRCSQWKCSGPACCLCNNTCRCLLTRFSFVSLSALLPQDAGTSQRVSEEALLSWLRPEAPGRPRWLMQKKFLKGQFSLRGRWDTIYSELRRTLTQRHIQMTGMGNGGEMVTQIHRHIGVHRHTDTDTATDTGTHIHTEEKETYKEKTVTWTYRCA